jgi:hypothetical protein
MNGNAGETQSVTITSSVITVIARAHPVTEADVQLRPSTPSLREIAPPQLLPHVTSPRVLPQDLGHFPANRGTAHVRLGSIANDTTSSA